MMMQPPGKPEPNGLKKLRMQMVEAEQMSISSGAAIKAPTTCMSICVPYYVYAEGESIIPDYKKGQHRECYRECLSHYVQLCQQGLPQIQQAYQMHTQHVDFVAKQKEYMKKYDLPASFKSSGDVLKDSVTKPHDMTPFVRPGELFM
eukprot:TRINITY_DN113716_c0_g1_i1.p1 TRINITY_DN113716_c0_g1~~TRINITY_DN113716_c0_g1_i1.p1  ORF type:complete len:161 (-),score=14.26 TRINITY_DN113716_c0_g1_i1:291-731(-)